MQLSEIEKTLTPILSHFQSAYKELTDSSEVTILEEIAHHLLARQGKHLRPTLMLLSACCCGFPLTAKKDNPIFKIAAAIEALHNSTLLHDDVVDRSEMRRGSATINKLYNNKVAVLAGDYFLAKVMMAVNEVDNKKVTEIINNTVIEMSEGELLQQQYNSQFDIDESVYFDIIRKKTAVFIALSCQAGAIFSTIDDRRIAAAKEFGEALGMAFQIRDDILDYMPSSRSGKTQGNDLVEKRCTLPLILALRNSGANDRNDILQILNNETIDPTNMGKALAFVIENNGLLLASRILSKYIDSALTSLEVFPDNKYRQMLQELAISLKEI